MKEQIKITLTDLDDFKLTITQLSLLFEKILNYYAEENTDNFEKFIQGFVTYFYILNQLIEDTNKQEGEEDENKLF